ncbi:MAG: CinA family protein [Lachnospiraceae bacterium]|nr:CinA family protein [Lachnospiraceae bacterium]
MNIQTKVVNALMEREYEISFAESCTGGLASAAIVSVPDASKVLGVSFVTYANEAKIHYLGVKEASIAEYGVVSEQVAHEMAAGVAKEAGTEVGIGITGIAGPGGGTKDKPVGMVCFGICIDGEISTYTKQFGDIGRDEVRAASVDFVLRTLYERLN